MDVLDAIVIGLVLIAIVHGARVGAAVQLISFLGFCVGLGLGVVLVVTISPDIDGQVTKAVVALIMLLAPAAIFGGIGRIFGGRLAGRIRQARLGRFDAVGGAAIAALGTLVVSWLFASILVNSSFSGLSRQIEQWSILAGIDKVMPPVPNAFASVERYLSNDGFPQVLVNILPESLAPVTASSASQVSRAAVKAGVSTVKIVAIGCGEEQEGSGFVAGNDLVVTNAHVIAGTSAISIYTASGSEIDATPVLFDARFDLAVLRAPGLDVPALRVDPDVVERGQKAVVLGYPEGGPFTAVAAGIESRFAAQGRDIYDNALTDRIVYELDSTIRPGNSGGPLVTPDGYVIGVVFSRSASNTKIGYALASPGVAQRINEAKNLSARVSTEACAT